MGRLMLVTGGQKSGKSRYAEKLAEHAGGPTWVVTPAVVRDPEFAERVKRHREDRPNDWNTLECFDLDGALGTIGSGPFVIVDALDTWLAEQLIQLGIDLDDIAPTAHKRKTAEQHLTEKLDAFSNSVSARSGTTVVIAGQPGLGAHVVGAGARAYVDLHGLALQQLARSAEQVLLIVAGLPVTLKGLA